MVREHELESLLSPILDAMGYDMVRVQISGTKHPTMQVMVERRDGVSMTVDDCAAISRAISAVLDVEDPFDTSYSLEVSSPGIDRPLTKPKDFERFQGFEARIEMREPIEGRRRFKGRLEGLKGDTVLLNHEGQTVELPVVSVQRAKLILTDELIAATTRKQ